ncbi:hypothetical protein Pmani_000706 [Petrolisthes manimaculis]|uniref:Mitochondrial import receptor subunit TOM22 homolog n=1 Tax=Petrolisthes manimaculis TaxID=1843537 RepID=A0AAE1QPB2_9EUCA|nr:hypothetical protein Pmani_000706 [Petrolisthes manimaculis]
MATLTEITDQDSGVASSEATPESQNLSPCTTQEKDLKEEVVVEEEVGLEAVTSSAAEDNKVPPQAPPPDSTSLKAIAKNELDDDDDDDEDLDETLMERLWGLTEMFPERLRNSTVNATTSSISFAKGAYEVTRQVVWIAVSTSVILFAPVMFELERLNVEEMMKQDRNRLVLGPGSAMSGPPPTPGLMPPPPTR